jgi:hypothetical protein
LIGDTGASTIVFASGPVRDPELVEHHRRATLRHRRVRILAQPRFYELGTTRGGEIDALEGYPPIEISPPPQHRPLSWAKRTFETLRRGPASADGTAPRRHRPSGSDVQPGAGDLPPRPSAVRAAEVPTMRQNLDSDVKWSAESDPRVTRVGRFLRDSHLDELPQLVNVVRGEMALVSPRPERPHFVEQFEGDIRCYEHTVCGSRTA